MGSRSNVGGVFSVVMWRAEDSGRSDPPTSLDSDIRAVRVPVISAQSGYQEVVSVREGVVRVEHTLTLVTFVADDFWGEGALAGCDRVGCIAEVELSSCGKILLGWTPKLGSEQPLRLTKCTANSATSVNDRCTKSWVFRSYSTQPLI